VWAGFAGALAVSGAQVRARGASAPWGAVSKS
jgi:hypothetical protein